MFKNVALILLNLLGVCIIFIGIVFLLNYAELLLDRIGDLVPGLGKLFGWQRDWVDRV
jgi:hypothetical protein